MNSHQPRHICFRMLLSAGFILAMAQTNTAQPFESYGASFAGAGRSAISWCDYDNDHDVDVLVAGLGNDGSPVTKLYRNDGGTFADAGASFIPVGECAASWGDFDADGDLDLLMSGNAASGDITRLYRNDDGNFAEMDPGLPGIQDGDVCWADIDNDGDLDVFLTGNWLAKLYINEDGIFNPDSQVFGFFSGSAAAFGDYDNDGDLDLLINGDSGAGAVSKLFCNEDGAFTLIEAGFAGLMAGTTDWVDTDNDGDLDAVISGYNDALEAQCYLYRNEQKQFVQVVSGIDGFALGSADWGDYDLDGDADLVMSGKATGCGALTSGVYRNDGNNMFYKLSDDITAATRCSLGWADFENDGDLDFIMAGLNGTDVPFTKIYLNAAGDNEFTVNTPPQPPDVLGSFVEGDLVSMSWTGASDLQTAESGLNYNLRIGSQPGGCDVLSPMALCPGGSRMLAAPGNAGQAGTWLLEGLAPGTYYWSIQSIDQAYEGSAFSTEESFTIVATGTNEVVGTDQVIIYPNPSSGWISVINGKDDQPAEVTIMDLSGRSYRCIDVAGEFRIDVSDLPPGVYIIRATSGKESFTVRFCRN